MSDGYFSVADRGTFGHWDISDQRGRIFTIRGDKQTGFDLIADSDRVQLSAKFRRASFDTPYEALEFVARTLMESQP